MNRATYFKHNLCFYNVICLPIFSACVNNHGERVESEPTQEIEEVTSVTDEQPQDAQPQDSGVNDIDTGVEDASLVWQEDLAVFADCQVDSLDAMLVSFDFPSLPIMAGDIVPGEVVYANCSDSTWIAAEQDNALSGVKLGAVAETVMQEWSRPRIALPHDVPPNYAVRIRWEGVAPLTNGRHRWQWQLLDEWVSWLDGPTPPIELEVVGGYGPFNVHSRDEWELNSQPVEGPMMDLLELRYIVIHYNGATVDLDGEDDVYTDDDMINSLRNSQASYLSSRGYSLGYNSKIAPNGDEWEVRGYDIRSGANGCLEVNRDGFAIQIPTTSPDAPPTPAQIEGVRAAILRIRNAAATAGNPNALYLVGHGDVRPLCSDGNGTECPGIELKALLANGYLEP